MGVVSENGPGTSGFSSLFESSEQINLVSANAKSGTVGGSRERGAPDAGEEPKHDSFRKHN